ncbi:kinase-like domain-containing protein [Blastocladiella britannica]|nr:kinase-like domain-containing protein [Blastocladiella britannica]
MPLGQPSTPSAGPAPSPMPNVLNLGHLLTLDDLNVKYDVGDIIGTGAFSEVRRATERATGVQFAVKVIDKSKCRGKETMIQSEVEILKRVKHRNIIRLFELYESPQKIFLIMEVVTGGELFDRIVARGFYTETDAAKLVCEIMLGVQYLHSLNICHRDLKPENLLFYDNSPNSRIMISDFGLSKIISEEQVMKTACGTPGYVAPEVLRREVYSKQVDMWSIGVITYILLCGYPPFYEENNHALFQQIMQGNYEFDSPYWDNISFEAKNFVARLLVVDSKMRMTALEALAHPFVTNHCADQLALARGTSGQIAVAEIGGSLGSQSSSLSRRQPLEPNLAPAINQNLRSYAQRRSSDKLAAANTTAATAAVAIAAAAAAAISPSASSTIPRANPALRSVATTSTGDSNASVEPTMNPLRPKTEHRDVDDSGLVASHPDVHGGKGNAMDVAAMAAGPRSVVQPYYSPYGATGAEGPTATQGYHSYPQAVPGLAPGPVPYAPMSHTQTRQVRFLTYSIFMRTPGMKNLQHSDYKNARLDYFISHILPHFDVVCLQEMYAYGSMRLQKLQQCARQQGFVYQLVSPSKGLLNGCTDGGLVTLSRFEIVDHDRITFKRNAYNCRFVAKGALYARIKLGENRFISCVNTNLQKSASHDLSMNSPEVLVRQTQIAQIKTLVDAKFQRTGDAFLIVGDFNLNARPRVGQYSSTQEYAQMMKILRGDLSGISNRRSVEEVLPVGTVPFVLPVVDLALEGYGYHPVTYGDVERDSTGVPVRPFETILTDKADHGVCHSTDFALWMPSARDETVSPATDPATGKPALTIHSFAVEGCEWSQLSDHYAVEMNLQVRC